MRSNLMKSITFVASITSGLLCASVASAEDADVPTYLLANLYVENMDDYMKDYATPLGPILMEAGGEILVVAPEVTRLEGDYVSNLTVVVRFPSAELANAFYASDAYAAVRPARHANTDLAVSTLVLAPEFALPASE